MVKDDQQFCDNVSALNQWLNISKTGGRFLCWVSYCHKPDHS